MVAAMKDPADIARQIGDVIRFGTIASVDYAAATCTVHIGDLLTGEVCWLAFRAGGTAAWSPPTIGEQCLLLCPEGDTAAGVALVGIYSSANPAPSDSATTNLLRFADGAEIRYDSETHELAAVLPAGGRAIIEAPEIELRSNVRITGKLTVEADLAIGGKADVKGDVVGAGISLSKHTHLGVQPGSGKSQGPLP